MKHTLQTLAKKASSYFEERVRASTDEKYWQKKSNTPQWVIDLIKHVHTDKGAKYPTPSTDGSYEAIVLALDALSYSSNTQRAIDEIEGDVNYSDLKRWRDEINDFKERTRATWEAHYKGEYDDEKAIRDAQTQYRQEIAYKVLAELKKHLGN